MPDPIALGLDYSARRLSGASIKAAGYSFVFRYLDFPGQRWPALNAAEYQDLTNHDVEVQAIFEISVHDPSTGALGGRQNAVTAVNSARAAGLPQGSTIFMCSDAPKSSWSYSMDTAMAYLDAARIIIEDSGYVIGAYGFSHFIYAAQDGGHADVFWLAGSESGVRDGIHAYQQNYDQVDIDGVDCDVNKMYIPIGDGMALSNEDINRIWMFPLRNEQNIDGQEEIHEGVLWLTEMADKVALLDRRFNELKEGTDQILAAIAALGTTPVNVDAVAELAKGKIVEDLND